MSRALICSLVGEDPAILGKADLERVLDRMETRSAEFPIPFFLFYKMSVFFFGYATFPFALKIRPFHWLGLAARLRYLEQWDVSRTGACKGILKLLKLMAITSLLDEPALLEYHGYAEDMAHRQGHREASCVSPVPSAKGGAR